MPCTKCLEARRKLLEARSAREAAAALAEAIRINVQKTTALPVDVEVNIREANSGQSRA